MDLCANKRTSVEGRNVLAEISLSRPHHLYHRPVHIDDIVVLIRDHHVGFACFKRRANYTVIRILHIGGHQLEVRCKITPAAPATITANPRPYATAT